MLLNPSSGSPPGSRNPSKPLLLRVNRNRPSAVIPELPTHTQPLVVSYFGLRRAIGVSGLLLPIVLWPVGWWLFKVPVQDNMSSYYYTPLRDVFVGTMFAIGVFLFCYRGNDWIEN